MTAMDLGIEITINPAEVNHLDFGTAIARAAKSLEKEEAPDPPLAIEGAPAPSIEVPAPGQPPKGIQGVIAKLLSGGASGAKADQQPGPFLKRKVLEDEYDSDFIDDEELIDDMTVAPSLAPNQTTRHSGWYINRGDIKVETLSGAKVPQPVAGAKGGVGSQENDDDDFSDGCTGRASKLPNRPPLPDDVPQDFAQAVRPLEEYVTKVYGTSKPKMDEVVADTITRIFQTAAKHQLVRLDNEQGLYVLSNPSIARNLFTLLRTKRHTLESFAFSRHWEAVKSRTADKVADLMKTVAQSLSDAAIIVTTPPGPDIGTDTAGQETKTQSAEINNEVQGQKGHSPNLHRSSSGTLETAASEDPQLANRRRRHVANQTPALSSALTQKKVIWTPELEAKVFELYLAKKEHLEASNILGRKEKKLQKELPKWHQEIQKACMSNLLVEPPTVLADIYRRHEASRQAAIKQKKDAEREKRQLEKEVRDKEKERRKAERERVRDQKNQLKMLNATQQVIAGGSTLSGITKKPKKKISLGPQSLKAGTASKRVLDSKQSAGGSTEVAKDLTLKRKPVTSQVKHATEKPKPKAKAGPKLQTLTARPSGPIIAPKSSSGEDPEPGAAKRPKKALAQSSLLQTAGQDSTKTSNPEAASAKLVEASKLKTTGSLPPLNANLKATAIQGKARTSSGLHSHVKPAV